MPAVTCRPAAADDLPAVVALHRAALPYSLNSRLGAAHLTAVYQFTLADPDSLVVCAMDGPAVLGVVSATLDPAALPGRWRWGFKLRLALALALRPALWPLVWESGRVGAPLHWQGQTVRACLTAIAVAPAHRRRGCGRALVAAVDAFMQARGQAAYRLDTLAENAAGRAFYARLGFTAVARRGAAVLFAKAL